MIVTALFLAATVWTIGGIVALGIVTRRRAAGTFSIASPERAVSILKPLCGLDASLESNLRSFFEQSYGAYELVFGTENPNDPALAVVHALRAEYPHVRCRVIRHSGGTASNPKVRNLLAMLEAGSHDLFVISDSNVRVPTDYLHDLVRTRENCGAGIVTNVIVGVGESSLGGAIESAHLNGFCASGASLPTLLGEASVIGKSMLMSRSELESLGGLHKVSDVLAEDFVLGKMYQHGGLRVVLARTVIESATGDTTVMDCFRRQRRWATLRWRVKPATFVLELLTSPVVLSALAWLGGAPLHLFVPWAFALSLLRDASGWATLRGARRLWIPVLVGPGREAVALAAWLVAPWRRAVAWRGNRMTLGAGTILFRRTA